MIERECAVLLDNGCQCRESPKHRRRVWGARPTDVTRGDFMVIWLCEKHRLPPRRKTAARKRP